MVGASRRAIQSGLYDLARDDDDDIADSWDGGRSGSAGASAVSGSIVAAGELPERLAVPIYPFNGGGFRRLQLQLIRCGDSLLASGFTSRELLVERLGQYQPWIGMPGEALLRLVNESSIDGLVLDPAPDLAKAVWTKEALAELRKVNDARL